MRSSKLDQLSALDAMTLPILSMNVSVFSRVLMALRTMRFSSLLGSKPFTLAATLCVNASGNWLKVCRVAAWGIYAEVIWFQSHRNRPNEFFVDCTVNKDTLTATYVSSAIAAGITEAHPEPTRAKVGACGWYRAVLVNLGPEAFGEYHVNSIAHSYDGFYP